MQGGRQQIDVILKNVDALSKCQKKLHHLAELSTDKTRNHDCLLFKFLNQIWRRCLLTALTSKVSER